MRFIFFIYELGFNINFTLHFPGKTENGYKKYAVMIELLYPTYKRGNR